MPSSGIVVIVSSGTGIISPNVVEGYEDGTRNDSGIYIAVSSSAGSIMVANNVISYFNYPVTSSAPYNYVANNIFRQCTNGP